MTGEIYEEGLSETVARIDERTDAMAKCLDRMEQRHLEYIHDHERRVSGLEESRDRVRGGAKLLASLVAVAAAVGGWLRLFG